jgi:hypothetical protein
MADVGNPKRGLLLSAITVCKRSFRSRKGTHPNDYRWQSLGRETNQAR